MENIIGEAQTIIWISCSEALPSDKQRVILIKHRGGIDFGYYDFDKKGWVCTSGENPSLVTEVYEWAFLD